MTITSYIWVEVEQKKKDRLFLKCFKNRIPIYETSQIGDKLYIKIKESDFSKIKKFWFVKVKKNDVTGFYKLKENIFKYHIFLFCLIIGLGLLFIFSHVMVSVEVIHSKKEIRDLVFETLKEKGIKKNTFRKNFQEIEKIKNEILHMYPEKLEWMEIEVHGMNYVIRVEERKIEEEKKEKDACHIVAKKDGIVKKMIYSKGQAVVLVNDSVKKGDLLISGIIKKDEETRGVLCATGEIYAEVWYQVSASIPMNYDELVRTGKKRFNLRLRNSYYDDFIFKSRLDNYEEEKKSIFQILGNEFFFVTQYETLKKQKSYTEEEALEVALESITDKINATLSIKEEIIEKKVLKKEINNSTMNVEVFVSVLESIGEMQEFIKE